MKCFSRPRFLALKHSSRIAQKQKKRYIQASYKDSSQSFLSINKTRSILFFLRSFYE